MKVRHRLPRVLLAVATMSGTVLSAKEDVDPKRVANIIPLDEIRVRNLGIQTVEVETRTFETTVFAIGRIEEIPANRFVLSSRISGRAVKVHAFEGDIVEKDQVLVEVESRQPGDPPPMILLRAPQSGLVVASHVRVGQPVEPETELLDISDRSEVWAVARIPENEAAEIDIGDEARIRIPAVGGEPRLATLTRYGVEADRQAGTVDGVFPLPNDDAKLQPGMRAEFSIITARRSDVMAVPRMAVQGDPTKRVVYVKDFELPNAFVRVPVQVGEQNDQYIEIVRGLFPGDDVVTQGSYSLGFAGTGSVSLKDALDAAHGHEHNEDGSEIVPGQHAAKETENHDEAHQHADADHALTTFLKIYAVIMTILFVLMAQLFWRQRRTGG